MTGAKLELTKKLKIGLFGNTDRQILVVLHPPDERPDIEDVIRAYKLDTNRVEVIYVPQMALEFRESPEIDKSSLRIEIKVQRDDAKLPEKIAPKFPDVGHVLGVDLRIAMLSPQIDEVQTPRLKIGFREPHAITGEIKYNAPKLAEIENAGDVVSRLAFHEVPRLRRGR